MSAESSPLSLLSLPREIRDQILEDVLRLRRDPPASPTDVQKSRVPFVNTIDAHWPGQRNLYVEPPGTPPPYANLLGVNRQLRAETQDAVRRQSLASDAAPYVLDVMFVDHVGLVTTWLSHPGYRPIAEHVHIEMRVFTKPPAGINPAWLARAHYPGANDGWMGTTYNIMALLTTYLQQACAGPDILELAKTPSGLAIEPQYPETPDYWCDLCPTYTGEEDEQSSPADPYLYHPPQEEPSENEERDAAPTETPYFQHLESRNFSTVKHITINVTSPDEAVAVSSKGRPVFGHPTIHNPLYKYSSGAGLCRAIEQSLDLMSNSNHPFEIPGRLAQEHLGVIDIYHNEKLNRAFSFAREFHDQHDEAIYGGFFTPERRDAVLEIAKRRRQDGLLHLEPRESSSGPREKYMLYKRCNSANCWNADKKKPYDKEWLRARTAREMEPCMPGT